MSSSLWVLGDFAGERQNMVKRSTLKDQIKALLIKRILEGVYRSGDRLVELRIAREMGTSQAPVREALRELASLRLVENVPHKGTRVRSLGKQELLETFLVRGALEECATRLATPKLKTALAPLRAAIKEMVLAAKQKDLKKVVEASIRFHRLIVEAAGNRILLDTWLSLHIETHSLVTLLQSQLDLASVARSHQAIVDAIATGDSEMAARVARDHQNFYLVHTAEHDSALGNER
ncbi:MAG TPA: GntR family transcriptional regulator [Chthoniobacterales bacterium]|jgi:DNA-binding GntR family transcriptional regulator|nr:GntR family transcriptional regulator [Chthoniobacterales bacterium]